MWFFIVVMVVVVLLVLHGVVSDFRMRRLRKQAPPLTDQSQRDAEVLAALGPRGRRRTLGRLFGAAIISDLLSILGRGNS